jgi:hypothetical protein
VATLRELREAVLPTATVAGAGGAADPVVGWVRVLRARVPAFDALEPGDLVIAPASALEVVAPTPVAIEELAGALVGARAAGLLVLDPATGVAAGAGSTAAGAGSTAADRLVAIALDAGLAVLRLPGGDPGTIERSAIGFLVNRRGELEHQVVRLEQRLERLALGRTDLAGLVAEVGAFLGRPVALEGRRGDPLAIHADPDDPAAASDVTRYLGGARGSALRARLPGTPPDTADGGAIVLLGVRPPSELERLTVERIAGLLALELAREEAVRRARDAARRAESLPSAGPPWVVLVARQVAPGGRSTIEQREATRRELRLLAPARRMALRGDAESLELRAVLAVGDDPGGLALAARIASLLGRSVAVSRPFSAPGDRPGAEADARATLEAVEALATLDPVTGAPAVARADRLPAYRLLGGLHNVPDGRRQATALLAPLLAGSPAAVADRLATLRAVLETPGAAEAAAALGIHRNTLAYRVRRIEASTGWRIADPEFRLALSIAVRLVQSAQVTGPQAPIPPR